MNGAGTPAVVFGPGDLRVAHTSNEHVPVDDLVSAARVYARAFVGFLGTAPAGRAASRGTLEGSPRGYP